MTAQVETGHLCPITMTRAALAPLAAEPALTEPIIPKVVERRLRRQLPAVVAEKPA